MKSGTSADPYYTNGYTNAARRVFKPKPKVCNKTTCRGANVMRRSPALS